MDQLEIRPFLEPSKYHGGDRVLTKLPWVTLNESTEAIIDESAVESFDAHDVGLESYPVPSKL